MFDIPFSELFIIGVIALVVLGPDHLPGVARTVGGFVRRARRFMENVKEELGDELKGPHLEEFQRLRDELVETRRWAQQSSQNTMKVLMDESEALKAQVTDPEPAEASPLPAARPRRRRRRSPASLKKTDGPAKPAD